MSLQPPAPSPTPPPRVEHTGAELATTGQSLHLPAVRGEDEEVRIRRPGLGAALFPAAVIVFLVLAMVAITWTVVASAR